MAGGGASLALLLMVVCHPRDSCTPLIFTKDYAVRFLEMVCESFRCLISVGVRIMLVVAFCICDYETLNVVVNSAATCQETCNLLRISLVVPRSVSWERDLVI